MGNHMKFTEKLLSRSNSYNYYKDKYESLLAKNNNLVNENKKLKSDVTSYKSKTKKAKTESEDEIRYLQKRLGLYSKPEILNKIINEEYSDITIAIKTPNPKGAHHWGDYFVSQALKKSFEKKGFNVIVQDRDDWYDNSVKADINFVLRGLVKYKPNFDEINIMWNISHPERVRKKEYEEYDLCFIASEKYADQLNDSVNTEVKPLLQCTDPEVFFEEKDDSLAEDILFVGSTREVYREIIKDVLKTGHDVSVYGKGWENFIDEKYIKGVFVENAELHKHYSSCKILLNDHWQEMKDLDFPSNRLFDALACGTFVISDKIPSAETLFEDTIVTYENADDLDKKLEYYLSHEDERKELAERGREIVLKNHTFDNRVETVLDCLKNLTITCPEQKENILKTNLDLLSNYEFDNEPLVSIIILNKDGLHHLKRLFKDFSEKTNYSNYEIIVVDNASEDDSVEYLKSLDLNIRLIENKENVSFAKGNNDAVKIANGEYVLLLNNDIEPTYGWLNELVGTIVNNDNVASVGAKLIYPFFYDKNIDKSFSIQHAGDILRETIDDVCLYKGHNQNKFSKDIFASEINVNKKRLLVTGAVLLIKKSIYEELGGLDESYWYGYEDIDFNLKAHRAGYDTMFASSALLFHHESATRKTIDRNNHKVFCRKWSKYLFKKLLRDKIERNYFFTDKKLDILLVGDSSFGRFEDAANSFIDYCADNDYDVNVSLDKSDLKIGAKTDIVISFTEDYDIGNVRARDNLIRILVSDNKSFSDNLDYDIFIEDADNLSETVFSRVYATYLE